MIITAVLTLMALGLLAMMTWVAIEAFRGRMS